MRSQEKIGRRGVRRADLSVAGVAGLGRAARAARRGGFDPARAAADAESRDHFPRITGPALRTDDVLFAAGTDKALESMPALPANVLIYGHLLHILAESILAVQGSAGKRDTKSRSSRGARALPGRQRRRGSKTCWGPRVRWGQDDDRSLPQRPYLTTATASISTLTSRGSRATWTVARAGLGALKNSA